MTARAAFRAARRALVRLAGAAFLALAVLPARAFEIREAVSPGGIAFWTVEEPSIPIVSVEIGFDGGGRLDPEGREGLARLTAALLDEGAEGMDAVAFARARDDLSARFAFSAGRDGVSVGAQMLVETMDPAAELLAAALAAPSFDAEAVERVRARMLSGIAQDETDPAAVAEKAWAAAAWPDHAYGRHPSRESVTAIARDDLIRALPRLINRANATVAVVGAISPDRAGALVDAILGGIAEGAPRERAPVEPTVRPGVETIDLPVPQSAAFFGHGGVRRDDPDFFPAYVANHILGGGSTSRLNEEVREKRGLAYSVYSYLSLGAAGAAWAGGVQTANESMAESIATVRAEWARMAAEGASAEELDKAKKYLTGAFALRFDGNARIASYLVFMQEENLGADYRERRNGLIEAVTLDDVRRAAGRFLRPENLMIAVAGRPEGLETER